MLKRTPRKVRDDPLADHLARGRIDQDQYRAGREFQKHFALADKRRPADFEQQQPGNLTADQLAAWKWLAKAYRQLGKDGSALVHDALINARTTRQIAEARGKTGLDWERYYFRRLRECLNTLALTYGFVGDLSGFPDTPKRAAV